MLHISLTAEKLFQIGPLWVTNSLLTTWIVMLFLVILALIIRAGLKERPGTLQLLAEGLVGGIYGFFQTILGNNTGKFFPLVGSIFIFLMFVNWAGLLPGVGSIGLEKIGHEGEKEFIPLFRAGSADLNTSLALALISMITIQLVGIKALGVDYLRRFFNFRNPLSFYVGVLELVSEFSKVISFSFRLFGNIFAGEVLLAVIAFLIPVIAPIPFLGMEIFVGFIQALVFSMLTAVFINAATVKEH